jgi:hypothetical protein
MFIITSHITTDYRDSPSVLGRQPFADGASFADVVQESGAQVLKNPAIAGCARVRNQFRFVTKRYLGVVEVHGDYIAGLEGAF